MLESGANNSMEFERLTNISGNYMFPFAYNTNTGSKKANDKSRIALPASTLTSPR
jgi:hypothetical protein